jgi:hypothetical protein
MLHRMLTDASKIAQQLVEVALAVEAGDLFPDYA